MAEDRFERQKGLLPMERLQQTTALVVGVGAIGLQVVRTLATAGIGKLILVDHDKVEVANLGAQGWDEYFVGDPKVEAAKNDATSRRADLIVDAIESKFQPQDENHQCNAVVFCCVDSMAVRKEVFESCRDSGFLQFFCDGRMSAETLRVLTASMRGPFVDGTMAETFAISNERFLVQLEMYEASLFADSEAHQESCTARSTFYSANIAASVMVGQFLHWIRGDVSVPNINLNLRAWDMWF